MIRPGKSSDAFALAEILTERQRDSRFAGKVQVDGLLARRLFAQAAQRHGGTTDGATFLMVSERKGEVEAFMLGSLSRVYIIGDALCASDTFLLGRQGCSPVILMRLLDAYIAWAEANPRVCEIGLSWADSIPGSATIQRAYTRRGFTECARTYRRDNPNFSAAPKEMAA